MKKVLQETLRQIRGFTRQLLESTDPDWVMWAPAGTSNHMLWHAGHAVWVQDKLCVMALTGTSELPENWANGFGMNCEPVATQTEWPDLQTVKQQLAEQQIRLHELMENMTAEQLVVEVGPDPDLVGGIIHGLHDEAKHHGEMYLLSKLRAAQSTQNGTTT